MVNLVIFLFGLLSTTLCAAFLYVTVTEMKKLGAAADERSRN